ncbi:MAG: hypothetical protein JWO42_4039, partial [Chloroflexi bacterium]|nr:hypothetical protein [Chloroflexota bacterium]
MGDQKDGFPTSNQLYWGAVLHTIAYAIFIAPDATLDYELSWDGINYNRQNSQGARGTIAFGSLGTVGVFFDVDSSRNPYPSGRTYELETYFRGISSELFALARDEALQYILDDYNGETLPVITSAFWSSGGSISAAEPWEDVLAHGAHLVEVDSLDNDDARKELEREYEFSQEQCTLLQSLFLRKTAASAQAVL